MISLEKQHALHFVNVFIYEDEAILNNNSSEQSTFAHSYQRQQNQSTVSVYGNNLDLELNFTVNEFVAS